MIKAVRFTAFALVLMLILSGIASAGTVLEGILKKGELVVGITGSQPPLNATSKDGEIIGFDADLARAIATNMKLNIKFAQMPFSELLPSLQDGRVDMVVSGMTMTTERNTRAAFIGPYFISGKGLLLKLKTVEKLKSAGLNSESFKVATLKGSTSQSLVEKAAPKAGLTLAESYDAALALLLDDKVDVVIADFPYCAYMADRYSEKGLVVGETRLSFEPLGLAVKEDALLINTLDNYLRVLIASGEMKELQDKWFKSRAWFTQMP